MKAPMWVALGLTLMAGGADPVGSAGTTEASGSPESTESSIVTQAVKVSPPRTSLSPPSGRDTAVLVRALADAHSKIAPLAAQAEGLPPGPDRDALQATIVRLKVESQISFLRLQITTARRVGDAERAALAERTLAAFSDPSRVAPAESPQTPDKGRPEGVEP